MQQHAQSIHHNITPLLGRLQQRGHQRRVDNVRNDRETGQFHLMAMLGLRPGENAFYSSEGWKASVVPQQIENYPFSLTRHPQDQAKHMVAVDLDSARVSDSEGEPLFTDSGEQTGVLQDKVTRLSRMMEEAKVTADFVKTLADMALLAPQSLSLTWPDGESRNLTGLYAIDEQKLNSLDTASFESLRQKHFVGAIYACILSMGRIDNLIERSAGR